jgi:hypothetical protein
MQHGLAILLATHNVAQAERLGRPHLVFGTATDEVTGG